MVLTSNNPRSEDPNAIIDAVLAGMVHPGRARVDLDRYAAIRQHQREIRPPLSKGVA